MMTDKREMKQFDRTPRTHLSTASYTPTQQRSPGKHNQDFDDQSNCEILNSYFKIRDTLRQSSDRVKYIDSHRSLGSQKQDMESQKLEMIQNIPNKEVSKMLMHRILERKSQTREAEQKKSNGSVAVNADVADHSLNLQNSVRSQRLTEATCSSRRSQECETYRTPTDIHNPFLNVHYQNSLGTFSQQVYEASNRNNYSSTQVNVEQNQLSTFSQVPSMGDPRNLGLFDFAINKSPYSIHSNTSRKTTPQRSASVTPHRRQRVDFTPQQCKSGMSSFLAGLNDEEMPKYSPAQSRQSGERLHNNYYIYQHKLAQKRRERDQEVMSEVKQKPTICRKSEIINQQLQQRSTMELQISHQSQVKRHHNCYVRAHPSDNDLSECTHSPQINKRSSSTKMNYDYQIHQKSESARETRTNLFHPEQQFVHLYTKNPQQFMTPSSKGQERINKTFQMQHQSKTQAQRPQTARAPLKTMNQSFEKIIHTHHRGNPQNNYQSFGPSKENQPTLHQNKPSYGDEMLRRLCNQYQIEYDPTQWKNNSNAPNYIPRMISARDVIKDQNKEEKIIQKILEKPSMVKLSPSVKPNIATKSKTSSHLDKKTQRQKQDASTSILSQIREFQPTDEQRSYFNVQQRQGQNASQPVQVKSYKRHDNSEYFQSILREPGHSKSEYNQVRSQRKSPNRNLQYQQHYQPKTHDQYQSPSLPLDWRQMPVFERNQVWKSTIDHNIHVQRQEKMHEEIKECHFRPNISPLPIKELKDSVTPQKTPDNYTQRSNSQSPLNPAKPQYNYSQLSNNKKQIQQQTHQKYPYQVQLRVLQKNSSYCSSPGCSTQRSMLPQKREQNIASEMSPLKTQVSTFLQMPQQDLKKAHFESSIDPTQQQMLQSFLTSEKLSNLQSVVSQYLPSSNFQASQETSNKGESRQYQQSLNTHSNKSLFDLSKEDNESARQTYDQRSRQSRTPHQINDSSQASTIQRQMQSQGMEFTLMNSIQENRGSGNLSKQQYPKYHREHKEQQISKDNDSTMMTSRYNEARSIIQSSKAFYKHNQM